MLTSKRQEWILQMIKGPDIVPVSRCPGHYTSRSTISITADDKQVIIRPPDVLDLSNSEFLVVQKGDDYRHKIPWDRITCLDFEEQRVVASTERLPKRTAAHRMLPFPMGKKLI